jgi:hypothetical protein
MDRATSSKSPQRITILEHKVDKGRYAPVNKRDLSPSPFDKTTTKKSSSNNNTQKNNNKASKNNSRQGTPVMSRNESPKRNEWIECFDPKTQRVFYHNKAIGKSIWKKPEEIS